VAKQVQRNREAFTTPPEQMPVFGTMAARFNDDGVTALYQALLPRLGELGLPVEAGKLPAVSTCATAPTRRPVVPAARTRYLAEISDTVRGYKQARPRAGRWPASAAAARSAAAHAEGCGTSPRRPRAEGAVATGDQPSARAPEPGRARKLLAQWPDMQRPTPATSTW
jgi:methylmalonyl-CoA mutase